MAAYDVTLVTCDPLPEHDPDMEPLREALDDAGLTSRVRVWSASNVDWSDSAVTLIRSTWDYYHNRPGFVRWAQRVEQVSTLFNPSAVVEWNSHKSYLLDLEARGLPIIPTVLLRSGAEASLSEICDDREWTRVVVKPAVSAASFQTHVVECDHLDERLFERLLSKRDMLVQPYIPEVESSGERSVISLDGSLSHCIGKRPRFHGEDEAISGPLEITDAQADLARRALDVPEHDLLYGRVDMVETDDHGPLITELELIEPSLFLSFGEEASGTLANALAREVSARRAAGDTSSTGTNRARS